MDLKNPKHRVPHMGRKDSMTPRAVLAKWEHSEAVLREGTKRLS